MVQQALEKLDALSVQVMVGGADVPGAIAALSAIQNLANEAGKTFAAKEAAELARRISESPSGALESVLGGGLESLRRALDASSATESPAGAGGSAINSIAQDPELIADFVNEASEHLATIEAQVLLLERDPASADPVHAAFRSFHTIKGLAGFLELNDIREVSHEVETLLDRARNRELSITPRLIDIVLESADYLKRAIAWVHAGLGGDPGLAPATTGLLDRLKLSLESGGPAEAELVQPPASSLPRDPAELPVPQTESSPASHSPDAAALTLRVDAAKLDYMVDMVGELVIAQSLVSHNEDLSRLENTVFQRDLQRLTRITGEVQRMAMSLRMTPVATLFGRMTRLVRDLSRKNGKQVRLQLAGEETELDKSIIEQLADPLMHMVRNSLDHGLESSEERLANGKSAQGLLVLAASHQAGGIVIEVSDDGRGLNTEKILKKARERGLVPSGASPTENEIFHLIFEPGFSTAERVTDVSGRGVGMDVVRRQIQNLRGRVEIQSAPGQGTKFLLHLPLTLAIIDGLIVKVARERYIVPIAAVRELLRPTPSMLFTIEGRAEMAMIRGELLPVVRLHQRFDIQGAAENPCEGLFVVTESEGRRFCLLIDQMLGKQEVVIKSLGDGLTQIAGISGGAILGDGRVGLILDVNGLFREVPVV